MTRQINFSMLAIFIVPAIVLVFGLIFGIIRTGAEATSDTGATATAVLMSPAGESIGTVSFRQGPVGVLVAVEANGLAPGGHAFIVHSVGSCSPDFNAAGDHFDPEDSDHGFIHSSWKRGDPLGAHGGDLPNIYAAADGSARADFFTAGISLDADASHTLFDADGSAVVIHEKPDAYEQEESDTGQRIACGVIQTE